VVFGGGSLDEKQVTAMKKQVQEEEK